MGSTEVSIHVHLTCFRFASTRRQWESSLARPPQCRNRRTDEMFHSIIDHVVLLLLLVNAERTPNAFTNQKSKKNVFQILPAATFAFFSFSLLRTTGRSGIDLFKYENIDLYRTLHQMTFDIGAT